MIEKLDKDKRQLTDLQFSNIGEIVDKIFAENRAQIEKHGVQTATPYEWMLWVTEEVGELAQSINDVERHVETPKMLEHVVEEAVHAATLLIKIAEMYSVLQKDAEERKKDIELAFANLKNEK